MSSALEKWQLGATKTLFESDALNLKVKITKRKNEKFKKFHSFVDLFELNIEKLDKKKTNIGLTFEKINLLESIVMSFYKKVMDLYSDLSKDKLKFQIDLTLGNLQ